jgi:hypothetical protein
LWNTETNKCIISTKAQNREDFEVKYSSTKSHFLSLTIINFFFRTHFTLMANNPISTFKLPGSLNFASYFPKKFEKQGLLDKLFSSRCDCGETQGPNKHVLEEWREGGRKGGEGKDGRIMGGRKEENRERKNEGSK